MRYSKEISAGVIVYRRTKPGIEFLLLYHGNDYWNFPKGRLNQGESDIQAALREVGAATGLKPTDLLLNKEFKSTDKYFFKRQGKGFFKIVVFFLAQAKTDKVKISWEHDSFGWFLYQDAVKILKYRGSKKVLEKAFNFIAIAENTPPARVL